METTTTKHASKFSRPILPKILIALLVILILAVIALAFVLYHLDRDISNNRLKASSISSDVKQADELIKELKKKMGNRNKTIADLEKEMENYFASMDNKTDN